MEDTAVLDRCDTATSRDVGNRGTDGRRRDGSVEAEERSSGEDTTEQHGREPARCSTVKRGDGASARSNHSLTGEFDPGSERTLAARLTHASRTRKGFGPGTVAHG